MERLAALVRLLTVNYAKSWRGKSRSWFKLSAKPEHIVILLSEPTPRSPVPKGYDLVCLKKKKKKVDLPHVASCYPPQDAIRLRSI